MGRLEYMGSMEDDLARLKKVAEKAGWLGVEEGLSYGTPALKVRGKLLARIREPGVVVLMCDLDEKEFLTSSAPEIYFETPHYKGWPAILARLEAIGDEELEDRMEQTWRSHATKKMLEEHEKVSRR